MQALGPPPSLIWSIPSDVLRWPGSSSAVSRHPNGSSLSITAAALSPRDRYNPLTEPWLAWLVWLPLALVLIRLISALVKLLVPSRLVPSKLRTFATLLGDFISAEDIASSQGISGRPKELRLGAVGTSLRGEHTQNGEKRYGTKQVDEQHRRVNLLLALALFQAGASAVRMGWTEGAKEHRHEGASRLAAWTYLLLATLLNRPATAPSFSLILSAALGLQALMGFAALLPYVAQKAPDEWLGALLLALWDLFTTMSAVLLILDMPVEPGGFEGQVPLEERNRLEKGEANVEGEDLQANYELRPTTPEDYTGLLSSWTYSWMNPIQQLALKRPLEPADIWRLRSINDVGLLAAKFHSPAERLQPGTKLQRSLLTRVLRANARDVAFDMGWKLTCVTLEYAAPALMKLILDCITDAAREDEEQGLTAAQGWFTLSGLSSASRLDDGEPQWRPRQKALLLACFSFILTLFGYVAQLKNFHHARQAGLRVRILLTGELFNKALRRRVGARVQKDHEVKSGSDGKATKGKANGISNGMTAEERTEALEEELEAERHAQDDAREIEPLLVPHVEAEVHEPEEASKPSQAPTTGQAESADVGKIVNMMASDVNQMLRIFCDAHQLYGAPMQVLIATGLLYGIMGWSALGGFTLLVAAIPLNRLIGRQSMVVTKAYREATDRRVSLVSEMISAIRWIKLQGLESNWKARVMEARTKEMRTLIRARVMEFLFMLVYSVVPIFTIVLSFYLYVAVQGEELTVSVAFTAITLFSMLRNALNTIPALALTMLQSLVSIRRLEAFLHEEEVEEWVSSLKWAEAGAPGSPASSDKKPQTAVEIRNGTFSYDGVNPTTATDGTATPSSPPFKLRDANVAFPPGRLSVISGPVASGKSTLLLALLGEMKREAGEVYLTKFVRVDEPRNGNAAGRGASVKIRSNISYASQTPWLEAGKSVKAAIVFVSDYDEARYREVLRACALDEDLKSFEDGDETRVSQSTLSGGQKARLALARALYAPSSVVLCDDVLAAVDVKTQRHIFEHALTGKLAKDRTIILVTHHLHVVLSRAEHIVLLENGVVRDQGSPEQLKKSGALASIGSSLSADAAADDVVPPAAKTTPAADEEDGGEDEARAQTARLLFQREKRRFGAVKFTFYTLYIGASSKLLWTLILGLSMAFRLAGVGEQYWLKFWGERASGPSDQMWYLTGFALIGLAQILLNSIRFVFFWIATYFAGRNIYTRLLGSVVAAPVRFFDVNPAGRILQRFNLDVDVIDNQLPGSSLNGFRNFLGLTSHLVVCAVIVPWFLVPVFIFFAIVPRFVSGFLAASRDIQRIESISTSPLYSVFTDSMAGAAVIRAFGAEERMLDYMTSIISITMSQWFAIATLDVWLSYRAQVLGGVFVFLATVLALMGAVSPGSAGVVLNSAALITQTASYLTWDYKQVGANLNSVERVAEYIDLIPEGGDEEKKARVPPAAWPSSAGGISVEDLTVKYAPDLPTVLHSINFDVKPGEKVALVGRTGSGKSTIASALLRAVDFSSGRIIIDGLDISSLRLEEMRKRLCIVPQDPVLFSGTLRENLDPFGDHEDSEIVSALRRVGIRATAREGADTAGTPGGLALGEGAELILDAQVTPSTSGASNFSAGEAQLLSLARALLRDARVVILDEATSNVDHKTDEAIQSAIRDIQGCVLTVAHRLDSIIFYDRILVLSQGRVVEFDSPAQLLEKREGIFNAMCKQSGPKAYAQLRRAAGLATVELEEGKEGAASGNADGQ